MSWFLSQDPISNVKVTVKVIVNQFKFGVLFLTSFFFDPGNPNYLHFKTATWLYTKVYWKYLHHTEHDQNKYFSPNVLLTLITASSLTLHSYNSKAKATMFFFVCYSRRKYIIQNGDLRLKVKVTMSFFADFQVIS